MANLMKFRSNKAVRYDPLTDDVDLSSDLLQDGGKADSGRYGSGSGKRRDSSTDKVEMTQERRIWWFKSLKLIAIMLSSSVWAFNLCINGPTVPDLRERLQLSMEQIARSGVTANLGNILGSVIGGLISDRFSRYADLFVGSAMLGMGVSLVTRPWSPTLTILCLNTFVDGLCGGIYKTAIGTIHFALWGSQSVPMYIKELGWTLVCPLIPLITKNFLSRNVYVHGVNTDTITANASLLTTPSPGNSSTPTYPWWRYGDDSMIEVPFAICGAVPLTLAFVYFAYQIAGPPKGFEPVHKHKTSWKEVCSPGSCADGASGASMYIIISLFLYFFIYVAANVPRWELLFSYAIEPSSNLNFTKDEASYLVTAGSTAHLVSRIISIFVSAWVPIKVTMGITVFGTLLSMAGIVFVGLYSKVYLWVFFLLLEVFCQPIWPGAWLWAEGYINVYSTVIAFFEIGTSLSGLTFSWINGKLYDIQPILAFQIGFGFFCLFALHCISTQLVVSYCCGGNKAKDSIEMDDRQRLLSDDSGLEDFDVVEFEVVGGKVRHLSVDGDAILSSSDSLHDSDNHGAVRRLTPQ